MTDVLCGAHRPGHFDGVATVVTKLFTQTSADKAYFGEKDFQQLMVVTRLARDLDIPVDVVGCPTIREEDGLAMSSRNLLLSDRARIKAPRLNEVMEEVAQALAQGGVFSDLQEDAVAKLERADFTEVDYFELRSCAGLRLLDRPSEPARLFAAAWLAGVRLIDNIDVPVAG
jgi:pantoate--beta-alanine ligase